MSKPQKFQVMAQPVGGSPFGDSPRMVVQLGPRYARPYDDTTTFGVFHQTTGGYVGVLLEQDHFKTLAEFLRDGSLGQTWELHDLQTRAQLVRTVGGRVEVRTWWVGSGRARSAVLEPEAVAEMASWMDDKLTHGWDGWRSGVRS